MTDYEAIGIIFNQSKGKHMTYGDSQYEFFKLEALPSGLFGETYVIAVGIQIAPQNYRGEYYILTQRPAQSLQQCRFSYSSQGVPEEFLKVDLDFIIQEARQQAEIDLTNRLVEKAEMLARPELLALRVALVPCIARPCVGCWLRGVFHDQIREVTGASECASLVAYLGGVTQLATFSSSERA